MNFKILILKIFKIPLLHIINLTKVMCTFLKVVVHYFHRLFCCFFGCFRKKKLTTLDLEGIAEYIKKCKNVIVMTGQYICFCLRSQYTEFFGTVRLER